MWEATERWNLAANSAQAVSKRMSGSIPIPSFQYGFSSTPAGVTRK